jgi:DNA-binding GntR family transcriptional regulator
MAIDPEIKPKSIVTLKLSSKSAVLDALVRSNKFGKAATVASQVPADCPPEELRKIVAILAGALAGIGDRHDKKGRPKTDAWDERNRRLSTRISMARGDYALAVIARDLVDDRAVSPDDLAWFFFRFCLSPEEVPEGLMIEEHLAQSAEIISRDLEGAREVVRSHAEDLLKEFRLGPKNVPRKGFKAIAAARMAERSKLHVDQIRPKRRQ